MNNKKKKSPAYVRFMRLWIIVLATILNIALCGAIGVGSFAAALFVTILLAINVFILLFNLVNTVSDAIQHTFDKTKEKTEFLYTVDVFIAVFANALFAFFYFPMIGTAMAVLIS